MSEGARPKRPERVDVLVRPTRPEDYPQTIELCRRVYPHVAPYSEEMLEAQRLAFPEGQLVAAVPAGELGEGDPAEGAAGGERVVGMAASLIVLWEDYDHRDTWGEFTERGTFANHDPEHGRTLYGAEVMVAPDLQGRGVGSTLYRARRELARRFSLPRIRAGARLRGYHRHAGRLAPRDYVGEVEAGRLFDPTLSFQLRRGFRVFDVVSSYLPDDPESLGYAALIEWLDPEAG